MTVVIMTDNNSTPDIQADPSKKSRGTRSKKVPGRVSEHLPVWQAVPMGIIKTEGRKGGTKYSLRRNGITHGEIVAGRKVPANYDMVFRQKKRQTARTYEVTFTSVSNRAKTFRTRVASSSLKGLLLSIAREIGNQRAPDSIEEFSVHFMLVSSKSGMTEEIVPVPLAEELPKNQRPTSDMEIEPLTLED